MAVGTGEQHLSVLRQADTVAAEAYQQQPDPAGPQYVPDQRIDHETAVGAHHPEGSERDVRRRRRPVARCHYDLVGPVNRVAHPVVATGKPIKPAFEPVRRYLNSAATPCHLACLAHALTLA